MDLTRLKNTKNLVQIFIFCFIFIFLTYFIDYSAFNSKTEPKTTSSFPKNHPHQATPKQIQASSQSDDMLASLKQQVDKKTNKIPSPHELESAAKILDFTNAATMSATSGWFAQADLIAFFIQIYLGEWQLAILPKNTEDKVQAITQLIPPEDLFSAETEQYLKDVSQAMATELEKMLSLYKSLTKYFKDETIQDEGVLGKKLAGQIVDSYTKFKAERQKYFEVIAEESRLAEDLFLTSEPLRRQIMAARSIFTLFQDVSWALADAKNRDTTRSLAQKLQALIDYAAMPPFRGKPLCERAFRDFLKKVAIYHDILVIGNEEGFYPETRKLLNDSVSDCRISYNAFAEMLNHD